MCGKYLMQSRACLLLLVLLVFLSSPTYSHAESRLWITPEELSELESILIQQEETIEKQLTILERQRLTIEKLQTLENQRSETIEQLAKSFREYEIEQKKKTVKIGITAFVVGIAGGLAYGLTQ